MAPQLIIINAITTMIVIRIHIVYLRRQAVLVYNGFLYTRKSVF